MNLFLPIPKNERHYTVLMTDELTNPMRNHNPSHKNLFGVIGFSDERSEEENPTNHKFATFK